MDYTIRFATKEDIEAIMLFIDRCWRKDHILARDRELFEWQYGGADERVNIVLGLDENGNIQGMLGFITYDDTKDKDIALALWKANPNTGFLGVKLIQYLIKNEPHREIVCPGVNPDTTSKIYGYVGMKVVTMSQWYRLASDRSYSIAKVEDERIPGHYDDGCNWKVKLIDSEEQLVYAYNRLQAYGREHVPFKSISYILKRYFEHPIYKYQLYTLCDEHDDISALIVFRVQECNGSRALRMIDIIGNADAMKSATAALDELLIKLDCEYIDVFQSGIKDKTLYDGGWLKVDGSSNIIPEYFAPYEQKNIQIHYSTSNMSAILFKGDGDQDRPN